MPSLGSISEVEDVHQLENDMVLDCPLLEFSTAPDNMSSVGSVGEPAEENHREFLMRMGGDFMDVMQQVPRGGSHNDQCLP